MNTREEVKKLALDSVPKYFGEKFYKNVHKENEPDSILKFAAALIDPDPGIKVKIIKLYDAQLGYMLYIPEGLLMILYDYIKVILSHNTVFEGIGHSSHPMYVDSFRMNNYDYLEIALENTEVAEFDKERLELHSFLFSIIVKFIISHELYHILNGHIDLIVNLTSSNQYNEEGANSGLSFLDQQTLEMDADCCAICDLYGEVLWHLANANDSSTIPLVLRNEDSITDCLVFCLFLLMSIFSKFNYSIKSTIDSTHPNSYLRLNLILETLLQKAGDNSSTVTNALTKTLNIFNKFTGTDNFDSYIKQFIWAGTDLEVLEHRKKILGNWNSLYPSLKKFAFVKLAAIHQE
jgi:hypothetical protein